MPRKVLLLKALRVTAPLVWALTAFGCSGGIAPQGSDGRLLVTDRLRTACPGVTDGEIDSLIVLMEDLRVLGSTRDRQLDLAFEDCEEIAPPCLTCNIVIIDQVYGE